MFTRLSGTGTIGCTATLKASSWGLCDNPCCSLYDDATWGGNERAPIFSILGLGYALHAALAVCDLSAV